MARITTIIYLLDGQRVLLAMKKKGHGQGFWNGPGGKVEEGETFEQACIRECQEEIGVTPHTPEKVAEHEFKFSDGEVDVISHVFISRSWEGTPVETDEMAPQWFDISDIPYDRMWQDDVFWLPAVLAGHKLEGSFIFERDYTMLESKIRLIKKFG